MAELSLNNKTVKKLENLTKRYKFDNIDNMLNTIIPILEWALIHEVKIGE